MHWVALAIAALFLWAWLNVFEKVLRTKYARDSLALTASFGIFNLLFALFLLGFVGLPVMPMKHFIPAMVAGFLAPFFVLLYLKAISLEEASRVVPLWNLAPIFTLLLAVTFLGENLALTDYAAFVLIVTGGFLISAKKIKGVFKLSRAVVLMLVASLLLAIADVLLKFAYSPDFFWKAFWVFYFSAAVGELSLFLVPSVRKGFSVSVKSSRNVFFALLFADSLVGFVAQLLYNNAILRGPISLVSSLTAFQGFFLLIIATFLSLKFPSFLKEAIDRKTLLTKAVAIAIMMAGVSLINGGV